MSLKYCNLLCLWDTWNQYVSIIHRKRWAEALLTRSWLPPFRKRMKSWKPRFNKPQQTSILRSECAVRPWVRSLVVLGLIFSTKKVSEYYSIFAQVSQLEEKQNKLQETLAELEKKAEQVKAKKMFKWWSLVEIDWEEGWVCKSYG